MSNRDRNISSRCCHQIQHIIRLLVALNHFGARRFLSSPGLLSPALRLQLLAQHLQDLGWLSSCSPMRTRAPGIDDHEVGTSQEVTPRSPLQSPPAFYPAQGCCLPSALNIWASSRPAHLQGCLHTRTHREDRLHSSGLQHPREQRQSNAAPFLHGKHQESSGTEDAVPAENREKVANPQQASL